MVTAALAFLVWPPLGAPAEAEVRAAVERAIPVLRAGGERWIEQKACVSCHRVGNMVWALGAAERAGFDAANVAASANWAVDAALAPGDDGSPAGAANREGVAQLLLAGPVGGRLADGAARAALSEILRAGQGADGLWPAGGQLPLQRRPPAETAAVSSLWIGLGLLTGAADAETVLQVERAAQAADAAGAGTSTEWFAARLLLAHRLGQTERRDELAADLRARRLADGGWGWAADDPGDALGTGLALYALTRTDAPPDDPAVAAGRRFLLTTQHPDGSWPVPGTKRSARGAPRETAAYWGTAWAVLGLIDE